MVSVRVPKRYLDARRIVAQIPGLVVHVRHVLSEGRPSGIRRQRVQIQAAPLRGLPGELFHDRGG